MKDFENLFITFIIFYFIYNHLKVHYAYLKIQTIVPFFLLTIQMNINLYLTILCQNPIQVFFFKV